MGIIKVLTYKEFDENAEKRGWFYPDDYEKISQDTFGIILNMTFYVLHFPENISFSVNELRSAMNE